MNKLVDYRIEGEVAVVTMDDGKVNAFSIAMINELAAAFVRAKEENRAVALLGREGVFSAGLDLKVMKSGIEPAREMLSALLSALLRIFLHPRPVVVGCTGHALAGGAIALLVGDLRVGAEGDSKIGLTEVAVGLPMPRSANVLARERLARTHLTRAVLNAEVFTPAGAVAAGFLDELAAQGMVGKRAVEAAHTLAKLPDHAFRDTKMMAREEVAVRAHEMLEEEIKSLVPHLV